MELELFFIAIFVTILWILPKLVTKLPEMTLSILVSNLVSFLVSILPPPRVTHV